MRFEQRLCALLIVALTLTGWVLADHQAVARALAQIVEDSYSSDAPARSHQLAEQDVNQYLRYLLEQRPPEGLEDISVRLMAGNRLITLLMVNLDDIDLPSEGGVSGWLQSWFTGLQEMEVEGILKTGAGVGTFDIRRARLNGYPLPTSMLTSLLESVGRKSTPPFDPTGEFELPLSIQRIAIETGSVTVYTAGKAR